MNFVNLPHTFKLFGFIFTLALPVTGYANGEELYHRMKTGRLDPFNMYFNPPLNPGDNTIIFKGKIKDLPKLSFNAIVMKGRLDI